MLSVWGIPSETKRQVQYLTLVLFRLEANGISWDNDLCYCCLRRAPDREMPAWVASSRSVYLCNLSLSWFCFSMEQKNRMKTVYRKEGLFGLMIQRHPARHGGQVEAAMAGRAYSQDRSLHMSEQGEKRHRVGLSCQTPRPFSREAPPSKGVIISQNSVTS